jgi:hypothetical protein
MRGIYVPLPKEGREALIDLADREWRDPRDQAAKFIVDGLKQAGVLPADDRLATAAPHGPGEAT